LQQRELLASCDIPYFLIAHQQTVLVMREGEKFDPPDTVEATSFGRRVMCEGSHWWASLNSREVSASSWRMPKPIRIRRPILFAALAALIVAGPAKAESDSPADPPALVRSCTDMNGNTFGWQRAVRFNLR
jgi:hypothetical protein